MKNANDIVTRVPSLLGYHHIGVEVQMLPDGQLTISRETSDDLREGAFAADIIPKIKGARAVVHLGTQNARHITVTFHHARHCMLEPCHQAWYGR